ncbi:galactose mutarotase-like [Eurosta solidaginis]|uniref:galactose mutarotase-like n=1 Tax=Eurosta solidaginis TaxID=178769 RepID=UPI00353101F9
MIHVTQDVMGKIKNPLTNENAFIFRFTLVNDLTGMTVQLISYGAAIYSVTVKDGLGQPNQVTLGYDEIDGYESAENPYFGATVGRVCNRIHRGQFCLDGQEIQLTRNQGKHHIHGGFNSFSRVPWGVKEIHRDGVTFCLISPDKSEGYPGNVFATVRYALSRENILNVYMTALTSKTTVVNMTNHSYFNLAGHDAGADALYEHNITIFANEITQTDEESIPTGEKVPVICTNYDFRTERNLGEAMKSLGQYSKGFDDNFCIHRYNLDDRDVIPVARALCPRSGLWMEVWSNQPGLQFYTSNFLPDASKNQPPIIGKSRSPYHKHGAFCFEAQKFPDAPNHPNFPSIVLKPGTLYENMLSYKFGTCAPKVITPESDPEPSLTTDL